MISYLPYFGRAYTAPIDPSDQGLNFTSTDFSYSVTPQKKGGWSIAIKPNDKIEIREYIITIFENGKASLQVKSTSRDPMPFSGYLQPIKPL